MKKVRGTDWSDTDWSLIEAASWNVPEKHLDGLTGFRLVYDSEDRVERGGSCLLDSVNARQARAFRITPAFPSGARGFRLAREVT